ncbi:hypothetical protein EON73_03510 [bacterium]|nr:MAG: hypothetical protein EON73_03510 [bacterium]
MDATKDYYVFSSFYGDKETNPYYIDSKYDEIRKVEVEVINSYLMKTFYDFSPEFRKMLQRWSQEKAMKRQLLIKQLKVFNFGERNKDHLSESIIKTVT